MTNLKFISDQTPRILTSVALCAAALAGCDLEGSAGDSDHGVAPGDEDYEVVPGTGGVSTEEPPQTGGSSTGTCDGSNAFQQAYVCAGSVYEERNVSQRSVRLYPVSRSYACHTSGTDLTPFEDGPAGEGPPGMMPGAGGASGEEGVGGGSAGDGDGDVMGSQPPGIGGSILMGDGDMSFGGAGPGTGGGFGMGGGPGGGSSMGDGWCTETPDGVAIAGVTYSLDDCGESEVKLPLVFQEPVNWYRLRVFHGQTACDRGDLVADTSGFGNGEIVELDVDGLAGGFVTLEFTADVEDYYDYYWYDYYYYGPYYYGDALHLELEPVGPNLDGE